MIWFEDFELCFGDKWNWRDSGEEEGEKLDFNGTFENSLECVAVDLESPVKDLRWDVWVILLRMVGESCFSVLIVTFEGYFLFIDLEVLVNERDSLLLSIMIGFFIVLGCLLIDDLLDSW